MENKSCYIENSDQFEVECLIHTQPLYNLARHLTLDEVDADDLFQDTLARGYQFFHKFKSRTNCKAWLFKIMKNLFINQYRKKKKRFNDVSLEDKFEMNGDKLIPEEWQKCTPENFVLKEMLSSEVVHALNILPEDYKMAVILADLEYMSYNEISKILECPVGTVRSRLSRGRKILKDLLFDFAIKEGILNKELKNL
ncbi:MAG: sigma-70 family RNA polymerase sigma factor [Spirochaetota bacterium]|nr:sigma-70 family RNA polymerase sigma factor [Spirochaetota bacterium]